MLDALLLNDSRCLSEEDSAELGTWGMGWDISGVVQGVGYYVCFGEEVVEIQGNNSTDHKVTWRR